jgi:glutathione synthase/RimK-type ligase-like ATP-grasp enzyme
MHVALVKHSSKLNVAPFRGDLSLFLQKMADSGIQCDIQPWDKPNVQWSLYSHIILTSEIEYHNHIDEFLQWVSNSPSKLLNARQVIQWNYNKKYLLELESKKVRIPMTLWLDQNSVSEIEAVLCGLKQFGRAVKEVVIKNAVGADGTSVWRCKTLETASGGTVVEASDLERLRQQILSPAGRFGVMVQEFLPEILTGGEWSLIYFDKMFSHAVIKKPPSLKHTSDDREKCRAEFRVQAQYGGYFEAVPEGCVPMTLIHFGSQVLTKIPERLLYARVDVVMTGDRGPYLMELEVLDPLLFLTEPSQAARYFHTIQAF